MEIDLKGKTALVCGSSSGIGRVTAQQFAAAGARVVLLARNANKLQEVLSSLSTQHRNDHTYLVADFSDHVGVDHVVSAFAKAEQNDIHIVINNTGGPPPGNLLDAEVEALETAFTQHIKCAQVIAKACVPGMKRAGYGRIINIISTSVKAPIDFLGVSNVVRGAMASWSKTLSNELGPYGITVNNILPGFTATERLDKIIAGKSSRSGDPEDEVGAAMKGYVPLRRFAQPDEVANAITFLASDKASYINGINLPVDGGRTKSL